jgi:ribosomal protein S27E
MYGRYGNDDLTKFLLILGLVFMVISWFPHLGWFYFLAAAVLVWSLMRSFSRKIDRRRRELDRYLRIKKPIVNFFKLRHNKWRDRKTHVYFKCKKCKAVLRVPRGKGSIIVTCAKCGDRIEKKT